MVFLGGAVLANIVSSRESFHSNICSLRADGRQGGHVDIKGRMGGAGFTSLGEAGCEISIGRNKLALWSIITIHFGKRKHGSPPMCKAWRSASHSSVVVSHNNKLNDGALSSLPILGSVNTAQLRHDFSYSLHLRARPGPRLWVKFSRTGDRQMLCNGICCSPYCGNLCAHIGMCMYVRLGAASLQP